jgi:hypothetical protein
LRLCRLRLLYKLLVLFVCIQSAFSQKIARKDIVAIAHQMNEYSWSPGAENLTGQCGKTGQYVAGHPYLGLPYLYGGNDGVLRDGSNEFEARLKEIGPKGERSQVVGDASDVNRACAAGIDCSGYVSHSWGLKGRMFKVPTISAFARSKDYGSLRPGDAITFGTYHVVLVEALSDTPLGPRVKVCEAHQHNELTNCNRTFSFKDLQYAAYWEYKSVDDGKTNPSLDDRKPKPLSKELVSITPRVLAFGKVDLGQSKSLALSISNKSDSPLDADIRGFGGQSTDFVHPPRLTIREHSTARLPVVFTPSASGSRTASTEIKIGQLTTRTITVTGEGATHCLAARSQDPLELGSFDVSLQDNRERLSGVTVGNCGTEPVAVRYVEFHAKQPWSFESTGLFPRIVPIGTEAVFQFLVKAVAASDLAGTITIHSDAADDVVVQLHAHVLTPCLRVLKSESLHLGDVIATGDGIDRIITLESCGEGTIQHIAITERQSASPFDLLQKPEMLPARSTKDLVVRFRPTDLGTQRAEIDITADGVEPIKLTATANVIGCLRPDQGQITLQERFPRRHGLETRLTVLNCGTIPLSVSARILQLGKFRVVPVDPSKELLLGGENETFRVFFLANKKGTWTDSLLIGWGESKGFLRIPLTAVVRRSHWWSLR